MTIGNTRGGWNKNWYEITGSNLTCPRPYYAKQEADEALDNTISTVEDLGLNYFLHDGTCLGFIREQGYIPWDFDIDLIIIVSNEDAFKSFVEGMKKGGFRYRPVGSGGPEWWKSHHWWWWVRGDKAILVDVKYECPCETGKWFYIEYEKGPLNRELDLVLYNGKEYNVPRPVKEYLTRRYDKNWMTPVVQNFRQETRPATYPTSPHLRLNE